MQFESIYEMVQDASVFRSSTPQKVKAQLCRLLTPEDVEVPRVFREVPITIGALTAAELAIPYPWREPTGEVYPGTALCFKTINQQNDNIHYVFLTAHRRPDGKIRYSIQCGDMFLASSAKFADGMVAQVLEAATQYAAEGDVLASTVLGNTIPGVFKGGSFCHFWKLQSAHPEGAYCHHVCAILESLEMGSKSQLKMIQDNLTAPLASTSTDALSMTLAVGSQPVDAYAFKVPVLLEGDAGSGKTREGRMLAKSMQIPCIEMAGHESVEAWELFGQYVQCGDGTLVWKDGKLAQAVRKARTQKVVFLLDEILRIPQRHLSALLTALSPFEGEYQVSTGRIVKVADGVGEEEVISCPVSNLAIVATTNVGPEYAVDEMDPAVAERFVILRRDTTSSVLQAALQDVAQARQFSMDIVAKLVKAYNVLAGLCHQQLLARKPSTRILVRALELANTEAEVLAMLGAQALQWVSRDGEGRPVKEELELVSQALQNL